MFARIYPTRRTPLSLPFFDYLIPSELEGQLKPGQLVTIPFRSRDTFGVVQSIHDQPSQPIKNIKAIKNIAIEEPFLSTPQLAFIEEIATLYHTSPGFLVEMNLPPLQKRKLEKLKEYKIERLENSKKEKSFGKPTLAIYKNHEERRKFLHQLTANNEKVLVLVPETPELSEVFNLLPEEIQKETLLVSSDLSTKEFFEVSTAVWQGKFRCVLGTRRALFLPFPRLDAVVLDNDGNTSHKSWDMAPRFHTREAAMYLGKHYNIPFTIATNSPALESYYFAKHGVYQATGDILPSADTERVIIADSTNQRRGGNKTGLSQEVLDTIQKSKEGFIFLFLNRRGSGGYVSCQDCRNVVTCPNCKRSFTYHQKKNELQCHFCKITQPMVLNCTKCGGINLGVYGSGTEQIERDIRKIVSGTSIYRIDSDAPEKSSIAGDTGIIIATQMGWHNVPWEKVKLTVFVDPDAALFIPEYRATEQLWHHLQDALFRMPPQSRLVVQTKHPDHIAFQSLAKPELFYEEELKGRKLFGYPPYNYVLKLFFGHFQAKIAEQTAQALYRKLALLTKNIANCTITPPLESTPYFHEKKCLQVLVIKVPYAHYKRDIRAILAQVPETWKVDPNPNSLLSW